jgi:hypothetical protein
MNPVNPTPRSGATIADTKDGSYVDWPAILAGAIVASSITFVLMAFGSALGLSFTNPFDSGGMSAVALAIALAAWLVWVQVSSFMAGGYVTGRMRRRMNDSTEHESDVRDGMHGLIVWATGIFFGGLMLALGAGGAASTLVTTVGNAAPAIEETLDGSLSYAADVAFRSDTVGAAETAEAREEVTAILSRSFVNDGLTAEDEAYLAGVVARTTGLAPEEAQARVGTMVANAEAAAAQAEEVAEAARRFAIVAAFIAAASLAISAVGAYWAAGIGGRHRDENVVLPVWFDRLR